MNSECFNYLRKYYSKLQDYLVLKRKLKQNSVLISLLNIKSNAAYEALSKSAIQSMHVPKAFFDHLLSIGYIRRTDIHGYSTITCKGVWKVEDDEGNLNLNKLLGSIDAKFFDVFARARSLTDKEKIVILSMISVRSFSENSALDLKKEDRVLTELQELIVSAYRLLQRHNIIGSLTEDKIFGAKGNEHPVSNLIRHTDPLQKKTRGIFKNVWPQKYYLDLFKDSDISEEGLVFLFGLIVKDQFTFQLVNDLKKFCLENAYKKSAYLYDFSKHIFTKPEYDEFVPEAIERCFAKCKT